MLILPKTVSAAERDSLRRFGAEVYATPGTVLAIDEYQKKFMVKEGTASFGAALNYSALPKDSDAFAADYGYPTFSFGLRYSDHHRVRMHREKDSVAAHAAVGDRLYAVDGRGLFAHEIQQP